MALTSASSEPSPQIQHSSLALQPTLAPTASTKPPLLRLATALDSLGDFHQAPQNGAADSAAGPDSNLVRVVGWLVDVGWVGQLICVIESLVGSKSGPS